MAKDHAKIEQVFLKCYEEHHDALFRFSFFQTSNREVALDILQETFTRTWIYLKDGKKIDNLKAFLYKVAKNLIIDHRRKKKSYSLEAITDTGVDFQSEKDEVDAAIQQSDQAFVLAELQHLDDDHREILLLRYMNEMSIKEIADTLGLTENHVSVKIHRAVEKMKDRLQDEYDTL